MGNTAKILKKEITKSERKKPRPQLQKRGGKKIPKC